MVFGGQDLTQYRIQAVEEHLRHAPQGERGGQGYHLVIVATHVQAGKQRLAAAITTVMANRMPMANVIRRFSRSWASFFFQRAHDLGHQHGVKMPPDTSVNTDWGIMEPA